jgi:hypothetical protein
MTSTRRAFGWSLAASAITLGFWEPLAAFARADDDDDGPQNVFISPCGQPFRARRGAPYPVVDWFKQADKNGDGRLDHAEFMADAEAFFKILDRNGDGVLSGFEIAVYEHNVAPEILGFHVKVSEGGARLWLAQAERPGEIAPGGDLPNAPKRPKDLDESGEGASPYGFFQTPEPVTAADTDFRGIVRKVNYMKLADEHFTELDKDGDGYLSLAKLPKTQMQKLVERAYGRRRG